MNMADRCQFVHRGYSVQVIYSCSDQDCDSKDKKTLQAGMGEVCIEDLNQPNQSWLWKDKDRLFLQLLFHLCQGWWIKEAIKLVLVLENI